MGLVVTGSSRRRRKIKNHIGNEASEESNRTSFGKHGGAAYKLQRYNGNLPKARLNL